MLGQVVQLALFQESGAVEALKATPLSKRRQIAVQVRRGDPDTVNVDLDNGTCSCGRENCAHYQFAADLLLRKGETAKYIIKSAFHKELRRGDVSKACHWGMWMEWCYGRSGAIGYMAKIWSEETTNFALAEELHESVKEKTVEYAIKRFCSSAKIWEQPPLWGIWVRHIHDLERDKLNTIESWYRVDNIRAMVQSRDVAGISRALAAAQQREDWEKLKRFRFTMLDEMVSMLLLSEEVAGVFRKRYVSQRFEAEDYLLMGLLDSRIDTDLAVEFREVGKPIANLVDGSTLLMPPMYAYDLHTRVGKKMLGAWFATHPGVRVRMMTNVEPVDLRWGGGLLQLFWRISAFKQEGSTEAMDRKRWHEIVPDPDEWADMQSWCKTWPDPR